jgi:hypothetical protein
LKVSKKVSSNLPTADIIYYILNSAAFARLGMKIENAKFRNKMRPSGKYALSVKTLSKDLSKKWGNDGMPSVLRRMMPSSRLQPVAGRRSKFIIDKPIADGGLCNTRSCKLPMGLDLLRK